LFERQDGQQSSEQGQHHIQLGGNAAQVARQFQELQINALCPLAHCHQRIEQRLKRFNHARHVFAQAKKCQPSGFNDCFQTLNAGQVQATK